MRIPCYQPPGQPALLLAHPLSVPDVLKQVLTQTPAQVLQTIEQAGLRGRGGAGFYTARKWAFCQQAVAQSATKTAYIICNADEGEPGTYKDRLLLQAYWPLVIAGMAAGAYVIGAQRGWVYLREEYADLLPALEATLAELRTQHCLGAAILGSAFAFELHITLGAGSYVCGEETALLDSLEGQRGLPRIRPPFPVTQGYQRQPTVVNNVETFAAAAQILYFGAEWFKAAGTPQSTGTKLLSLSGDCGRPGVYEYAWGTSLKQVLADSHTPYETVQAIQISGAAGHLLPPAAFERRLAFEDVATGGSLMIYHQDRDLFAIVQRTLRFFRHESCGFCAPCRIGTRLLDELAHKISTGHGSQLDIENIHQISQLMTAASFCGLGQTAANILQDSLKYFPAYYPLHRHFEPNFDLSTALAEASACLR